MVQDDFNKQAPSQEVNPPDLPPVLTPGTLGALAAEGAVESEGLLCADETAGTGSFTELEISGARFSHCSYAGCDFTQTVFRDVVFEDCDLSNATFDQAGFTRCSFKGCKLTGASFLESAFTDVSLRNSLLSYSSFVRSRWKHVSLIACDLTGADLAEMEQRFVGLSECRFVDASFFRTRLAGMDFTTSVLENVSFSDSMTEFYGTKLSVYQAASLARLLGIIVEE